MTKEISARIVKRRGKEQTEQANALSNMAQKIADVLAEYGLDCEVNISFDTIVQPEICSEVTVWSTDNLDPPRLFKAHFSLVKSVKTG